MLFSYIREDARAQDNKASERPPENPRNAQEQTARTPNRETATRPKNATERTQPGFRETQKRDKAKEKDRQKPPKHPEKRTGPRGLEGRASDDARIEGRELGQEPLGLIKIPGPPGTAGILINPEPGKGRNESRENKIIKSHSPLLSHVSRPEQVVVAIPTPALGKKEKSKTRQRKKQTSQKNKG